MVPQKKQKVHAADEIANALGNRLQQEVLPDAPPRPTMAAKKTRYRKGNRVVVRAGNQFQPACGKPGCTKQAQRGEWCVAHGGGLRCQHPGCEKSAVPGKGLAARCVKHGGGLRCQHPGCEKFARPGWKLCGAHGGGYRCQHPGCEMYAVPGNGLAARCVKHGGGQRCQECGNSSACFRDEDGKIKYCGPCAIDLGLKPQASRGASMEACRCWHLLEDAVFTQAGWSCKLTHHVHFENGRTDPTGAEKEGLIPERKFKPDAFIEPGLPIHLPGETSGEKGAVFLYHGNPWHGFPKGHPKYEENNFRGTPNKLLFEKTVQQHELYKEHGYRVFFVWEHDFKTATRKTCPVPIRDVVREYLPPKTASPRIVLKQSKLPFAWSK